MESHLDQRERPPFYGPFSSVTPGHRELQTTSTLLARAEPSAPPTNHPWCGRTLFLLIAWVLLSGGRGLVTPDRKGETVLKNVSLRAACEEQAYHFGVGLHADAESLQNKPQDGGEGGGGAGGGGARAGGGGDLATNRHRARSSPGRVSGSCAHASSKLVGGGLHLLAGGGAGVTVNQGLIEVEEAKGGGGEGDGGLA